jgi:mannitol-1-phosphate 5-dehydrogenase
MSVSGLLAAVGAALAFDDPEDPQSQELQQLLRDTDAAAAVTRITGLGPEHPLFVDVLEAVHARQRQL